MLNMDNKRCLHFAVIVSMLICLQMAVAVSTSAKVASKQKVAHKKKPQKQEKGFWCATSDVTWKVDADSELLLEHEATDVVLGQAIRKVYPAYPPQAIAARVEGNAIVEAVISKTGEVASIKSVSAHPALIKASTESAKGWKFTETTEKGGPVEVLIRITFKYDLGMGKEPAKEWDKERKKTSMNRKRLTLDAAERAQ